MRELVGLSEQFEIVRRHLVGRVVHERADVGFGNRDLQPEAGVTRQIGLETLTVEPVLGVEVALLADAVDRNAVSDHLLRPVVNGVSLGVRAVLTGNVEIVVKEQCMRVGLVRPAEGIGDDALAEVRHPEIVAVDAVRQRVRIPGVGEHFVRDVPLPNLALEMGDLVGDVLVQQFF